LEVLGVSSGFFEVFTLSSERLDAVFDVLLQGPKGIALEGLKVCRKTTKAKG